MIVSLAVPPELTVYDPDERVATALAGNLRIVSGNTFVSVNPPLVRVAVKVTEESFAVKAGLTTVCPLFETIAVSLDAQVIVEPLEPLTGKIASAPVMFDRLGLDPLTESSTNASLSAANKAIFGLVDRLTVTT